VAAVLVIDDSVIYSASDLAAASRCEYALLRAFDAKLGRGPALVVDDDLLARTATLGDEHEQRRLDELRRETGGNVVIIGRPPYTVAGLTAAAEQTTRAVGDRAPAIYQAAMFDGRFAGFADFLVLDDEHYRVGDTKLARSAKVTALLQLAAYADTLALAGVPIAPEVELVLGDGAVVRYRVDELTGVYHRRRDELQRLLDEHYAGGEPVRWENEGVRACFRCPACTEQVRARDDLLLVAGMRVSQRARLLDAGISTIAELAEHSGSVPELSPRTVRTLTGQAGLQVRQRSTGTAQFEIADPQPLSLLPNPDDGDLFFDFEGDPLWTTDGTDWGLEYLFGVLEAKGAFRPLWAHDRVSERAALVDFLAMVRKRRKRYPNMHIYHYASYEKTALLRLAGRYGVGEDDVDDLLRNGVLVDLYPLVRKSIRVGAESYSLKALEPLYMGAQLRSGDVTTATDSITQYAKFCELRDAGRGEEAASVLKEVEDYNLYDCTSTRGLRDWLLLRAFECGVTPLGTQPVRAAGAIEQSDDLARRLAGFAGDAAAGARTPEPLAVAMVAAARGYHRREDKPFWWAHFDRLNNPVDEWADTSDVFVADGAAVVMEWCTPPKARKPQRHVRLTGELAAGDLPAKVFALYEPPAPTGLTDNPDRRAAGAAEVVTADDATVPTEVVIMERLPKGGNEFHQLPFALTPGPPVSTRPLHDAIETAAVELAAGLPALPRTAITDILLRRAPRTRSDSALPRSGDPAADITAALRDLDASYLAVHGPPGTGKTHTAAHVIARLVNDNAWRIGIVAQSHAAVEHLLGCAIAAGVDAARVAKKKYGSAAASWQVIDEKEYAGFIADTAGCVIGGTAWDFANDSRVPRGSLDLLVIEEAGQFCLANTIAVAGAADNLLLLGDPQQLPQVSQGTHPEPVDSSALGWLVQGHRTLPPERGYFLDRSFRMHPAVCTPVSALAYEGRLHSFAERTAARHLDGYPAGVQTLVVEHNGNATASPEEAGVIVAEIVRLLGRSWTDEHGTREMQAGDILVVAPYNAQVLMLRTLLDEAGLHDVPAGTVDKFQGREAPVVFVSMTASSIDDVPRGISFLLNRNRLNVAVSRAQYAAVIVRSAALTEYLPPTPGGLVELGAFLALTSCDTPAQ
jgi:predicted RecB family nuclease